MGERGRDIKVMLDSHIMHNQKKTYLDERCEGHESGADTERTSRNHHSPNSTRNESSIIQGEAGGWMEWMDAEFTAGD